MMSALVPLLVVASHARLWTQRHPWFLWVVPVVVFLTTAILSTVARHVASWFPGDPMFVLLLFTMAAVWTFPQQRWVRLHATWLRFFALHLVVLMQSVSAWATVAWPGVLAFVAVCLPNLMLTAHIAGCSLLYALAPAENIGAYRRFVWSMYSLTVPILLVPQACALCISSWLQDFPRCPPIMYDYSDR